LIRINPLTMKKIVCLSALAATLILTAFTIVPPAEWKLTDGYSIRFKGKRVNGFFHVLRGQINFDENNLSASSFKMEVDVASITTGNSLKSWNAKKKKWFDAKGSPTISFVSNKFQKTAKGYVVNGKLKMKGVERDVSVPFSFSNKIFFGEFFVKRSDYNVGKMKGFSKMVSDTIRIDFTIPVTK
jgi:polyisoprenoid-binding protein YceI